MNFLQRRKILKSVNYLDLTPVRMMEHKLTGEGKIDILLPRFKNTFWREVYRKSAKGEFIAMVDQDNELQGEYRYKCLACYSETDFDQF